jgi:hypothetical protein
MSNDQETEPWTNQEVLEVARRQKVVVYLLLAALIELFFPPIALIIFPFQIYFIYQLAKAVRSSWPWLYALLEIIPFVGLIVLVYLNVIAIRILRSNGIEAGLLGAAESDLDNFRENINPES